MIKIGEVRKWRQDTNNEHFKVEQYKSFFINEHYYIIKYFTDGRERTVSENELLTKTVMSHIYDDDISDDLS